MIGSISTSSASGFGALADYTLGKEKAQYLGGNMSGIDIQDLDISGAGFSKQLARNLPPKPSNLAAEFALTEGLSRGQKPCCHISLSLAPNEGDLDDDQWINLCQEYLEGMGFNIHDNQYFIAKHEDREHTHVHIVANRVGLTSGTMVSNSHDRFHSQAVLRNLEEKYELEPTPSSWDIVRKENRGKYELLQDLIDESVDQVLIESAGEPPSGATIPTATLLAEKLANQGIIMQIRSRQRSHQGEDSDTKNYVTYTYKGEEIAAHKLGRIYTQPGLIRRGLSVSERDQEAIASFPDQVKRMATLAKPLLDIWRYMALKGASNLEGNHYRFVIGPEQSKKRTSVTRGTRFEVFRNEAAAKGEPQWGKVTSLSSHDTFRVSPQLEQVEFSPKASNILPKDIAQDSPILVHIPVVRRRIEELKSQERSQKRRESRSR